MPLSSVVKVMLIDMVFEEVSKRTRILNQRYRRLWFIFDGSQKFKEDKNAEVRNKPYGFI
ncbi:hypothetical protein CS542_02135 [Pedobacter sp. IW39]|nr:hypothetical protein CS542_02135 [Pedobacter sp. IW39]